MPRLTVRTTSIASVARKRELADRLTQATARAYGVEAFAVTVQIVEQDRDHWARGGRLISETSPSR